MGKTTLVRAVMGLLRPTAGRVAFAGREVGGWPPHRIARAGIALVPEGRQVFPNLSVGEHLSAFHRRGPQGAAGWSPARVLEMFPALAARRGHLGGQLSGGEQQMLAIGRALVTNPLLLILDEATEGLAPLVVAEIWRTIAAIRASGIATLIVDRNAHAVLAHTDDAVVLEKGRVVLAGESAAVGADGAALARFLGV